jgi:hypothetical protein
MIRDVYPGFGFFLYPGSGFFHPRSQTRIRNTELTRNLSILPQNIVTKLGNMIRDIYL